MHIKILIIEILNFLQVILNINIVKFILLNRKLHVYNIFNIQINNIKI